MVCGRPMVCDRPIGPMVCDRPIGPISKPKLRESLN
jgi:hypothetical protein